MKKIIMIILLLISMNLFAIENDDFKIRPSSYDASTRKVYATISNYADDKNFKKAVFKIIGYDDHTRPITIKYITLRDFYYNDTLEIEFYISDRIKYTNKFDVEFMSEYSY